MPELPEVETVRRGLERHLVGRRILRLDLRETRLRTPLRARDLEPRLVGRRIEALERRGKYLVVRLAGDEALVVHLGMTGSLTVAAAPAAPLPPHTHVRLGLEGGAELRFADPRRFGMFYVLAAAELGGDRRLASLGPEPLGPDFAPAYLVQRARGVRKPIKNFLMDASVVAGLGNIYVTEALWEAGIHPRSRAGRLRPARWERLHAAVRRVLEAALQAGGTTLQDYRNAEGDLGSFQVQLEVYDREGEPCRRCGRPIRRIVQAGRSTFYCPGCQH
jgi:formamidopyrimidine-DNA glycosylase